MLTYHARQEILASDTTKARISCSHVTNMLSDIINCFQSTGKNCMSWKSIVPIVGSRNPHEHSVLNLRRKINHEIQEILAPNEVLQMSVKLNK